MYVSTPAIPAPVLSLMESRPSLRSGVMDGYTNRKTRRVFASLLRRHALQKLPPNLFPFEFIFYFVTNYPEVCHGQLRHRAR